MASPNRLWKLMLLLAGAVALSAWVFLTGPTTQPEDETRPPKIVKTLSLQPTRQRITVNAFGSVIPARRVVVEPQVSGHIVRLNPKLIPAYGNLGSIYSRRGRHDKAKEMYEKILTLDPGNQRAKMLISQIENMKAAPGTGQQ